MRTTMITSAVLLLAAPIPAAASYVYAPGAEFETQEAGGQGIIFQRDVITHMQLGFDSSIFGTSPLSVQEISFRYDSLTNQYQVPTIFFDFGHTTIKLSTIADVNAMANNYAANLGSDVMTVLDRGYTLTANNTGAAGGPRSWGFVFTFDRPFLYDPSKGDLILDLQTGQGVVAPATLDMVRSGKAERYLFAYNDGLIGGGGTSFDGGPISRLRVGEPAAASVPEMTTWAMMLVGFGLIGTGLRRRRMVPAVGAHRWNRLA